MAAAALWLSPALFAAEASGPDKGSTPMLTIKPFNRGGDSFCVTCDAGRNPGAVLFVTRNDDATHRLLTRLDEQLKANAGKHLHADIIVLGSGRESQGLVSYIRNHHLSVAAATVDVNNRELRGWKINAKVSTTLVLLLGHQVHHSVADLPAAQLAAQVRTILPH